LFFGSIFMPNMVNSKAWLAEFLWLTITVVLVVLVIWPIRQEIYNFPFEKSNIYFIVCCVTGLRWLLLLPSTPFAKNLWVKLILIFICIWVFIFSFNRFGLFSVFLDEKGIESLTIHLPEERQIALSKYIASEYIFFSVGAMIACVFLPFRLIISIWRTYNQNTV